MNCFRRSFLAAALTIGALYGAACSAQTLIGIETVPTGWRMQDYGGGDLMTYYTGSSCGSGALSFVSGTGQGDLDMYWSLILWAKATGTEVVVYYYVSGTNCVISSFATSP